MNRDDRRQEQRNTRDTGDTVQPERSRIAPDAPREFADKAAREYYREDGGES